MEKIEIGVGIIVGTLSIIAFVGRPSFKTYFEWKDQKRKVRNDYRAIKELQENCNETKQILLLLLNHLIDGNNIAEMKRTREKLIETIPTGGKNNEN